MTQSKLTTIGPVAVPAVSSLREPDAMFKVELDERSFLFPTAKIVTGGRKSSGSKKRCSKS